MRPGNNWDAASHWISTRLHNWFHNDLIHASDLEYLHHHHTEEPARLGVFVLTDWTWLWHTHEQEHDQPHTHDGWDWSWHEHGVPTLTQENNNADQSD